MNYMGHTQPARENPSLQFAIEQGGYLAPPETRLRLNTHLTDSLTSSETSLLSTRNLTPDRQTNSALPSISPHQPTFANVPLRFSEQLKDPLNIREEERSSAQKELEKRHTSPKLLILMRFLEKHGGPKNLPVNATSPVKEISMEALRGLYGEQLWGLRNLLHTAPQILLSFQNLANLIKKARARPKTSHPAPLPLSLSLFYEEIDITSLVKKILKNPTGEKASPLHFALCFLLLSVHKCKEELSLNLEPLQRLDQLLSPLLFEGKQALNIHGLLLISALAGIKEQLFSWVAAAIGDVAERAKKPLLGATAAAFASVHTKLLYELTRKAPEDKRIPLQTAALATGLYSLLAAAPYFEELKASFLQRSFPVEQTAPFTDSNLKATQQLAAKNPELSIALRRCFEGAQQETSSKELIEKLNALLIPLLALEASTLKQYFADADALAARLTELHSLP